MSAAAEAKAAGYGGIAAASRVTKLARSTIGRGLKELRDPGSLGRKVRRKGGGSPRLATKDILQFPQQLGNARKTKEGGKHPDRDAQFEYINTKVEEFQADDQPVMSIDAKKKELLGVFKNGGSDYSPQGRPIEVNTHDFKDKEWARSSPMGSTTLARTTATSALKSTMIPGNSPSTAFGSGSIGSARRVISGMSRLIITADGGGSNGSRLRLWHRLRNNSPTKPA